MDETSSCKTCGCSLDAENQKLVGAWTFCDSCFEKLLSADSKPAPVAEPSVPEVSVSPPSISLERAPEPVSYECCICEKDFPGTAFKKISSASVCESCFAGLIPAMQSEPTPPRKPFVVPTPRGPNTMSQKDIDIRGGLAAAPAQPNLNCVACSKQLPAIGAAKIENGQLFCPDCFQARPKQAPVEVVAAITSPSKPAAAAVSREFSSSGEAVLICDCCERAVTPEIFNHYEGLIVCKACENYDLKSAIQIARSRHASLFEAQRIGRLKP